MKRLFPIALLLCTVFAMSSFAPVHHPSASKHVLKGARRTPFQGFPVTGTSFDGLVPYNYSISGSNSSGPSQITFTKVSDGTLVGTYPFTFVGQDINAASYQAVGMQTATAIRVVAFNLSLDRTFYGVQFIPAF